MFTFPMTCTVKMGRNEVINKGGDLRCRVRGWPDNGRDRATLYITGLLIGGRHHRKIKHTRLLNIWLTLKWGTIPKLGCKTLIHTINS